MAGEMQVRARGFLGADVEVKALPNGDPVAEFDVAIGIQRKPKNARPGDKWEDVRTDWVRVSAFGRLVEQLRALTRGTLVEVDGFLTPGAYLAKSGEARPSTDVRARSVLIVPRTLKTAEPVESTQPF